MLQKLHVNGIITSELYELSIRNQKYSMSARGFFSNNSDNISNYLNNCWLPLTALTVELLDSNKYWSLHKTAQLDILPPLLKSYSMLMVSLQHCGCINFLFKIRYTVWHLWVIFQNHMPQLLYMYSTNGWMDEWMHAWIDG